MLYVNFLKIDLDSTINLDLFLAEIINLETINPIIRKRPHPLREVKCIL